MSIPVSQFIPPPPLPLVSYVCSLHLCLSISVLQVRSSIPFFLIVFLIPYLLSSLFNNHLASLISGIGEPWLEGMGVPASHPSQCEKLRTQPSSTWKPLHSQTWLCLKGVWGERVNESELAPPVCTHILL